LTEQGGCALLKLLQNSEELRNFLANPFVKVEDKKRFRATGWENINLYAQFLMLLRRRILFAEICQQYLAILRELNQTVLAEVISAVELTEEQQQAVHKVTARPMPQVELDSKPDPDLIGNSQSWPQAIDATRSTCRLCA